jgi:hypothetical protein
MDASRAKRVLVVFGMALLVALALGGTTGCATSEQEQGDADDPGVPEPATPRAEIVVEGRNATVRIEPSVDEVVSGIVTITIIEAPDETEMAFFAMRKQGAEDIQEEGPNIGIDTEASDGWSSLLDTTGFENGVYEVSGLAMADADSDPLGGATAQVVFEN